MLRVLQVNDKNIREKSIGIVLVFFLLTFNSLMTEVPII